MTSPLISRAELAEIIGKVTVLDVRYRLPGGPSEAEFVAGHLPGAVFINLDESLAEAPNEHGRHPLPPSATFVDAMQAAGVNRDHPVVVYDAWSGHAAARAWWMLRDHGHADVRVLDGGLDSWVAAGLPLEAGGATPRRGDFTGTPGHRPQIAAHQVMETHMLIDARAPERYRGEVEPIDPVAGHIPGAVNHPTTANLGADGTLLPPEVLRETYAALGIDDGTQVATYCGSGVTACLNVLAMEVAGFTAALYPDSWSGWITDPSRPIQTG